MDNLLEQITNISKAHAFDIISAHATELKVQNNDFRKALTDVVNAIINTSPEDAIKNPSELFRKIGSICQDTLSKHRPL